MNKIKYIVLAVYLSIALTGCSKDYLENNPTTAISEDMAISNHEGLRSILEGVHSMLYSYYPGTQFFGMGQAGINTQLDLLGDDMINTLPAYYMSAYRWEDHTNPYGQINSITWDFYYKIIQHVNQVIVGLEVLKDVPEKTVLSLKGEAHTLRAWAYFNLVQLYGKRYEKGKPNSSDGVIIRKTVNIEPLKRASVAEVYAFIDEDIKIGVESLEKAPDLKRKNTIRYSTACGIAARIALAKSDWAGAEKFSDLAIKKSGATLQIGKALCDGFNSLGASEWMWAYTQNALQDFFFASYFCDYSYNFNGHNKGFRQAVNRSIYDKMGKNDARRGFWVCLDQMDKIPDDANLSYFEGGMTKPNWEITGQSIKFKAKSSDDSHGDILLMRLAEMYYIKAEAEARQNKSANALETLKSIMITRDPDYSFSSTGNDLIDEILRNKRIDLWMEGQRFFDMKRLGIVPDRLSVANFKYLKGAAKNTAIVRNSGKNALKIAKSADDKYWQFAIPYDEIKGNKLCNQNPL